MKKTNLLLFIISLVAGVSINDTYGFSIIKTEKKSGDYNAMKYLKVSEVVKLSSKEFGELTGKKMNLWNKVSFAIAKIKMKHDLKKKPNLTLMDYTFSSPFHDTPKVLKILYWILIALLAGILLIYLAASKQH